MEYNVCMEKLQKSRPKVHCLTNPVSMADVANLLLTAGGSAIMAQDPAEVDEITSFCQATLLNTGVPDEEKIRACILAGKKANELGHPVVLDPVGVGASAFRKRLLEELLKEVKPDIIRCNQEEACTLLHMQGVMSGGVESSVVLDAFRQERIAESLAKTYGCTALVSGVSDVVSDGKQTVFIQGGDRRIAWITGSGCMLSALCALFCGAGIPAYEAACTAGRVWKNSSQMAGEKADEREEGIGSFHVYLFDALDQICYQVPKADSEGERE